MSSSMRGRRFPFFNIKCLLQHWFASYDHPYHNSKHYQSLNKMFIFYCKLDNDTQQCRHVFNWHCQAYFLQYDSGISALLVIFTSSWASLKYVLPRISLKVYEQSWFKQLIIRFHGVVKSYHSTFPNWILSTANTNKTLSIIIMKHNFMYSVVSLSSDM